MYVTLMSVVDRDRAVDLRRSIDVILISDDDK